MSDGIFNLIFILVPILALGIFVFNIVMICSPKMRGKFMSRQMRATRYMMEEAKDDFTKMGTIAGDINVQTKKNILDQHEDTLKDIEIREANIEKEGIEIKTKAIKDGFRNNTIYCKHCGALIDEDSKFCKKCGKEQ